jgi:predicted XRE-type DNA-binding protein
VTTNNPIGSDFDEFLETEGLLAEVETTAVKRIIAYQIRQEMEARNISKSELAEMMKTSWSALDRLLDPNNRSVTLLTLETAAHALGKKLKVQIA